MTPKFATWDLSNRVISGLCVTDTFPYWLTDLFPVSGLKPTHNVTLDPGSGFKADLTVNFTCNLTSRMLTLAAPLSIFNVKTIEIFWGKSSQFTNSLEEEGKVTEV